MVKLNPIEIYKFAERNNLGNRLARSLPPLGTSRGLLEPQSAEECSREIGPGEGPLNRYLRKLDVEYLM